MKLYYLAVTLLLTAPAHAQSTTFSGALTSSDPTIPGSRISRNGVASTCGTAKPYPGSFGATGVRYHTYSLSAPPTTACTTVRFSPNCSEGSGANTFLSVYVDSFNPASLATNYVGDIGGSTNDGTSISAGINLPAGASYILVVSGVAAITTCSAYTITVTDTPLPVELAAFSAAPKPTGTALTWTTASELNNAHFVVERSSDGTLFVALGQVAGAGSSMQPHTYTYFDAQTPAGVSYYRLRQVDTDGSEHFSPVVVVRGRLTDAISFSPNPVTDQATFSSPEATTLIVHDGLGRTIRTLMLSAGIQQISLAMLPAGVYFLTDNTTHRTMRMVKVLH